MSVTLCYATTRAVDRGTAAALLAAAEGAEAPVWYEPVHLETADADLAPVTGWSKAPPMSVQLEEGSVLTVGLADWAFMDYWDSLHICALLSTWSSVHGVDWRLTAEGHHLGTIKTGRLGRRLRRHLKTMARLGGASGDRELDGARSRALRARYPELEAEPTTGNATRSEE